MLQKLLNMLKSLGCGNENGPGMKMTSKLIVGRSSQTHELLLHDNLCPWRLNIKPVSSNGNPSGQVELKNLCFFKSCSSSLFLFLPPHMI